MHREAGRGVWGSGRELRQLGLSLGGALASCEESGLVFLLLMSSEDDIWQRGSFQDGPTQNFPAVTQSLVAPCSGQFSRCCFVHPALTR